MSSLPIGATAGETGDAVASELPSGTRIAHFYGPSEGGWQPGEIHRVWSCGRQLCGFWPDDESLHPARLMDDEIVKPLFA